MGETVSAQVSDAKGELPSILAGRPAAAKNASDQNFYRSTEYPYVNLSGAFLGVGARW
jgi:hypothetical protein